MRDELTIEHDLIFKGESVVIPIRFRSLMKQKVHSSHMGAVSCYAEPENVSTGQVCCRRFDSS